MLVFATGVSSFFAILFFFAMNWPRLLLAVFDLTMSAPLVDIPTPLPRVGLPPDVVGIQVYRPRLTGNLPQLVGFVNDKHSMLQTIGRVNFSVCSASLGGQNASLRFNWTITSIGDELNETFRAEFPSDDCKLRWQAPREDTYRVRVIAYYSTSQHHAIAIGDRTVKIRDIWIAAVGDSFASGEGNPDTPVEEYGNVPAQWLSEPCHRSSRSWAFKIYEKIARTYPDDGILFTYIPCTGTAITSGILEASKDGMNGRPHQSQIDRVSDLKELIGRSPDLLLISAGGNDLGYAEIIYSILWGEAKPIFDTLDMRFFFLSHQFDRLASAITQRLGMLPGATVFPHYFDLTRNELGEVDANCSGLHKATTENFIFADKHILKRINKIITVKAAQHNWTIVDDVAEIFHYHGVCSNEPFILSLGRSFDIQGDNFGAFHPIEEAHRQISESVWSKIKHLLEP